MIKPETEASFYSQLDCGSTLSLTSLFSCPVWHLLIELGILKAHSLPLTHISQEFTNISNSLRIIEKHTIIQKPTT
ncbi:MAG: hypothetical protein DRJ59_05710 [Thermoprotei archaeon]|nr:MAG: hypothetical protein DRJ59_05710 [Thermoprotei archaeon]